MDTPDDWSVSRRGIAADEASVPLTIKLPYFLRGAFAARIAAPGVQRSDYVRHCLERAVMVTRSGRLLLADASDAERTQIKEWHAKTLTAVGSPRRLCNPEDYGMGRWADPEDRALMINVNVAPAFVNALDAAAKSKGMTRAAFARTALMVDLARKK